MSDVLTLDTAVLAQVLTRTDRMSSESVAVGIAAAGVPVLPVAPGGKDPLLTARHILGVDRNGERVGDPCKACAAVGLRPATDHGATTDPDVIRSWYGAHPDAGVGMKDHPKLLRGDGDFASLREQRDYWKDAGYTSGEPEPFHAATPGGAARSRFLHEVPDGAEVAGGGHEALGVSWYQSSGYVVVKGRHPSGHDYPPFKGDRITPAPPAVMYELGRRQKAGAPALRAASTEEVESFLKAQVQTELPHLLQRRRREVANAPEGKRHRRAVTQLSLAFRDAVAGYYPARWAVDNVRRALGEAGWTEDRFETEWADIEAWAVAAVKDLDPALVREEADMRRRAAQTDKYEEPPTDETLGIAWYPDLSDEALDAALRAWEAESGPGPDSADETVGSSWEPVDLGPALRGERQPLVPSILTRDDGVGLFYPGQLNGTHGDSGSGKSWLWLFAAAEIIFNDGHVVWIDFEDPNESTVVERLRTLGLSDHRIEQQFHYINPQDPAEPAAIGRVITTVERYRAALVVIDSVGEAFGLDGVSENNDDEVAPWFRQVPRTIMAATGTTVGVVDHVTKSGDQPLHPKGSARKRAAITGAQYLVEAAPPFSKDTPGKLRITCGKDRHGTFQRGDTVAIVNVTPDPISGLLDYRVEQTRSQVVDVAEIVDPMDAVRLEVVNKVRKARKLLTLAEIKQRVAHRNEDVGRAVGDLVDRGALLEAQELRVDAAGRKRSRDVFHLADGTGPQPSVGAPDGEVSR